MPLFYHFYNADPINVWYTPNFPSTIIGCVNDEHYLALGKSTKKTPSILGTINSFCCIWEDMHGAFCAQHKYVLVHLSESNFLSLLMTSHKLTFFTLQICLYTYV